jgi:hypothetical protein
MSRRICPTRCGHQGVCVIVPCLVQLLTRPSPFVLFKLHGFHFFICFMRCGFLFLWSLFPRCKANFIFFAMVIVVSKAVLTVPTDFLLLTGHETTVARHPRTAVAMTSRLPQSSMSHREHQSFASQTSHQGTLWIWKSFQPKTVQHRCPRPEGCSFDGKPLDPGGTEQEAPRKLTESLQRSLDWTSHCIHPHLLPHWYGQILAGKTSTRFHPYGEWVTE